MACSKILIILAIVAVFVPSISAVTHVVGDYAGWTTSFDYQAWAQGKEFYVGDKLVFNYPEGGHNVIKTDGVGFQNCQAAAGATPLITGKDEISLTTPGRKWYICDVGEHCEIGKQKLVITVLPQVSTPGLSMAPSPVPESPNAASSTYVSFLLTVPAFLGLLLV